MENSRILHFLAHQFLHFRLLYERARWRAIPASSISNSLTLTNFANFQLPWLSHARPRLRWQFLINHKPATWAYRPSFQALTWVQENKPISLNSRQTLQIDNSRRYFTHLERDWRHAATLRYSIRGLCVLRLIIFTYLLQFPYARYNREIPSISKYFEISMAPSSRAALDPGSFLSNLIRFYHLFILVFRERLPSEWMHKYHFLLHD